MGDRLRGVWDLDDLDATEHRFHTMLELEISAPGRAEVLTQLARVRGLRRHPGEAEQLLDEAEAIAGNSAAAHARVRLERGRLRRRAGDPDAALPLFETAFQTALTGGEEYLAIDAAYMAAWVAPDRTARLTWNQRGLDLAQRSTDAQLCYWLGPLLENLGWEYFASGHFEPALDAFERALHARERDPGRRPSAVAGARYAIGRVLRALGQPAEAAETVERAAEWASGAGRPDGRFHEELAEAYAALGREGDAREQARLALPLLRAADPSLAVDRVRRERLETLAAPVGGLPRPGGAARGSASASRPNGRANPVSKHQNAR
jgi:tetratricopeptide (TPR) repeat protein